MLLLGECDSSEHAQRLLSLIYEPPKRANDAADEDIGDLDKILRDLNLIDQNEASSSRRQSDIASSPSIARHLRGYVNNKDFADVTFLATEESGQEKKIFAHKAILATRCERFKREFQGDFKESRTHQISLADITPNIFEDILHYIYTDEIQLNSDNVVEILSQSNAFGLECLKQLCEQYISMDIDTENVVQLYEVADKYLALQLKAFCLYYIIKEFDIVSRTVRFQAMSEHLLKEITRLRRPVQSSRKDSENCVVQ